MNDYTVLANQVAGDYGIPANIFSAVIGKESGWNATAINTNSNGSMDYGLGQINTNTAKLYGFDTSKLLSDPGYNLRAAGKILADNFKRFGNWGKALSAYNTGSPTSIVGTVYATDVLTRAGDLSESGIPTAQGVENSGGFFEPADDWIGSFWESVKPYAYAIAILVFAGMLITAGIWKGVK